MNRNPLPKSVSQNNNLVQIKEEDEKLSSNPVQPNDINFYKLQNSKLFQKFLKEEGQPQKKFLNNYTTNSVENKSELPINTYQKNFRTNEDVPKRITPLKQANAREDNKYLSRKSNNEDEKELVGYSQIVPGFYHF